MMICYYFFSLLMRFGWIGRIIYYLGLFYFPYLRNSIYDLWDMGLPNYPRPAFGT